MKKKSKLKRLLEYCPRPSKPLTTTLKRYSIPIITAITSVAIFTTVSYFLFSGTSMQPTASQTIPPPPELPTLQSNYLPGVSVGDYMIYGNYICNQSRCAGATEPEWECVGEMDWKKVEVIGVEGKEVILRYTEQLKNGKATDHSGCVHVIKDIEHPSWFNESCKYAGYYFGDIIAANLTKGDYIHSSACSIYEHKVYKTEARTYLGLSRWTNILKSESSFGTSFWVFDRESGILLEKEEIYPNNERTAYSIIETNIFSYQTLSPMPSYYKKAQKLELQ